MRDTCFASPVQAPDGPAPSDASGQRPRPPSGAALMCADLRRSLEHASAQVDRLLQLGDAGLDATTSLRLRGLRDRLWQLQDLASGAEVGG